MVDTVVAKLQMHCYEPVVHAVTVVWSVQGEDFNIPLLVTDYSVFCHNHLKFLPNETLPWAAVITHNNNV